MNKSNPLMCDPQTGVCEIPDKNTQESSILKSQVSDNRVKVLYFTDPICSACWAIEPQLKKLRLEYGNLFTIEYCMGGLLPSWVNYNGGGIQNPADVAHHWDEISDYYHMPIDGNVWLEDPLSSSYPPSIAFKAAEMQDKEAAALFMRVMREMLFLEKKNIAKWENISMAAQRAGLDSERLKYDYDNGAQQLFEKDLETSRQSGVRGFPTLVFYNENEQQTVVYGVKSYEAYEQAILKLYPLAVKQVYSKDELTLITYFGSLTVKELLVLSDITISEAEKKLRKLAEEGRAVEIQSRKGSLWRLKK
ncbi:DsbA family protein [Dysgonomonas sp. HDW5A]|nr:DsbA family protein [Dysgonomonas sp. HDW5A]